MRGRGQNWAPLVRIKLLTVMEARLVYVRPTPEGKWVAGCKFDHELKEEELKVLVRE